MAKNSYSKVGTVISVKDTKYKYAVYSQSTESIIFSSNISGGFISSNFTISSDGWYGFVLGKTDDSNFNLGNTDSNIITSYLNFD